MSPRTSTFLTALGLLVAGAPLPFLLHTRVHNEHHHHHACCGHHHGPDADHDEHEQEYRVPATVRSSAPLRSIKLMLGTRVLAETGGCTLWEPTLTLPAADTYEIELIADWEEDTSHAFTISIDVPRRETRTLTRWADRRLHTLLRFSW